jgi:tetratricopeptide (TPR) repeat protein
MEKDAYYYYSLGVDALQKGSLSDAHDWLVKSTELGAHFKTFERLAFVLDQLGQANKAYDMLEMAYRLNPNNDQVAVRFAGAVLRLGKVEEAKRILGSIIKRNVTYGPALKLLAQLADQA